jgi:hypothetical protein
MSHWCPAFPVSWKSEKAEWTWDALTNAGMAGLPMPKHSWWQMTWLATSGTVLLFGLSNASSLAIQAGCCDPSLGGWGTGYQVTWHHWGNAETAILQSCGRQGDCRNPGEGGAGEGKRQGWGVGGWECITSPWLEARKKML